MADSGIPRDPTWPRGGLYLDGDGDGAFDKDKDYGFRAVYDSPGVGQPRKAFYFPTIIREARDRNVFGPMWPPHIATVEEVEERARSEDAPRYVGDAVRRLPHLAVLVFESEAHHVIADASHAIAQVNAWLDAGARWVRFNPGAHYVDSVMEKSPARGVQNPAGRRLDRSTIASLLEPWDHTKWDRRNIVGWSSEKVHVDTQFTRYRKDDTPIASYESLYVVTKEQGRWAIKMRSSFVP